MNDWLSSLGYWMEHHPGTASWAQAVGATLAVVAAVLVPALQARHARQQREADRRLRAKSLAIAIYPELLHIRVAHRLIQRRLLEIIGHRRGMQQSRSAIAGADLADRGKHLTIPISETLRGMVPNFYLLGEPIGPQVQRCIGRSMKYNDLLGAASGSVTDHQLQQLLSSIENGLHQVEACITGIEQTWQIAADAGRGIDDQIIAPVDPAPLLEPETRSKETV